MFMNPAITTAIAEQQRRDLIAQADTYRLAASQGRPRRLASPVLTTKRVVTTAVVCTAAALLLMAPAGAAHASGQHVSAQAVSAIHHF